AFAIIPGIAAVGVLGIVITAAFILWKIIQMVFLGPLNEKWANMKDMASFELVSMTPLAVFMVLIGLYPKPILDLINASAVAVLKLMG
ncbi:MAG: NADH-quinone oxidoreductase subunit M, partial [Chloroflexi bacterium]|nr:NADH-quinone oxidoreductase subunit M [Chloroflexota bacterium]